MLLRVLPSLNHPSMSRRPCSRGKVFCTPVCGRESNPLTSPCEDRSTIERYRTADQYDFRTYWSPRSRSYVGSSSVGAPRLVSPSSPLFQPYVERDSNPQCPEAPDLQSGAIPIPPSTYVIRGGIRTLRPLRGGVPSSPLSRRPDRSRPGITSFPAPCSTSRIRTSFSRPRIWRHAE